jgi:hypothetical protein
MADLKTTQETTRTPIDGTEFVRLATAGANWKAALSDVFAAMGGGDPLALIHGESITVDNPTNGSPTDRWIMRAQITTDNANNDPVFGNNGVAQFNLKATHGQANYNGSTQSKTTFYASSNSGNYNASGQKFAQLNNIISFGMSDSAIWGNNYVQYAGGPVSGDEGQGWGLVANLTQQGFLNTTTITAKPTQPTINTTTTQAIAQSKNVQTVNVVSTTGVAVGDWVVVEQELPAGGQNLEAVKVISFTATSITGVFVCNHPSGVTVTPALRFTCASTYQMGQDRVLVNMSQPSYSTGTVSGVSGGGLSGTGTVWSTTMVGGNAKNIGAISLACDDYIGAPFDAGANRLKDWYQINGIGDATHLGVHSFSVAADGSYKGKGIVPANLPSAYIIRPCARVLRIIAVAGGVTGELICESSSSAWAVGNNVEQVICPYPDVTGFQYSMGNYTNGGTLRGFMVVKNTGARTIGSVLSIGSWGTIDNPTADGIAWDTILAIGQKHNVTIDSLFGQKAAILLHSPPNYGGPTTDNGGSIVWDSFTNGAKFGPNSTNMGLQMQTLLFGPFGAGTGILSFIGAATATNPDATSARMSWGGHFHMPALSVSGSRQGYILIDNVTDPTNFERSFARWESGTFAIGTEKGGSGAARDFILKTNNIEGARLNTGNQMVFSPGSVTPASLGTNGQYTLTPTSNTNFRISYRGSDGTTRVGNITLA